MSEYMVGFEYVSPQAHPEHYCCNGVDHTAKPTSLATAVPAQDWNYVERSHQNAEDAFEHFRGLTQLIAEGELIRKPWLGDPGPSPYPS